MKRKAVAWKPLGEWKRLDAMRISRLSREEKQALLDKIEPDDRIEPLLILLDEMLENCWEEAIQFDCGQKTAGIKLRAKLNKAEKILNFAISVRNEISRKR